MPESIPHETLESFSDFLGSKGLRMTDQRVSRATVYRSLPLLVESGIIRKIDVGQENKFYALSGTSETFKAQVICSNCDRIHDVDAPFMEWYGKTVSEKLGLEVKDQRLQVQAECPEFRKNGNCSHTIQS